MKKLEDENLFKRINKQVTDAHTAEAVKAKKRLHSNGEQDEIDNKKEHQDEDSS